MPNINTKSYWDSRFASGDWEQKKGRSQTEQFAISQIKILNISKDFSGTFLDFGCGLGDAFPLYKEAFPKAKLIGIDISVEAIKKCKRKYGHLAEFITGDFNDVPKVDIIIASNVFEHLSDDKNIASSLREKCQQLNIVVPYKEKLVEMGEHINTYDENYFSDLGNYKFKIFYSKGWGHSGLKLAYHIYLKNPIRLFLGKRRIKRAKQIIFIFEK